MTIEKILSKHEAEIALVDDLGRMLESLLKGVEIDPNDGQQIMAMGLGSRLRTNAQACSALAQTGLSAEVKILARSCIEATFKVRALCTSPDLVRVYAAEHLYFQRRALQAVTGELKKFLPAKTLTELNAEKDAVEAEIKKHDVPEMKIWVWSQQANLTEMYRSLYALYSTFVHASSTSLADWLPMDSEGDVKKIVFGPTEFDLSHSLLAVATCLLYCMHDLNALMSLGLDEELARLASRRDFAYDRAT